MGGASARSLPLPVLRESYQITAISFSARRCAPNQGAAPCAHRRPSSLLLQPSPLAQPPPRRSPASCLFRPPKRSLPPRLHPSLAALALIVIVVPHPRFLYRPHQLTNPSPSLTKPAFPKAPRLIGILSSSLNPPSPFTLNLFSTSYGPNRARAPRRLCRTPLRPSCFGITLHSHASYGYVWGPPPPASQLNSLFRATGVHRLLRVDPREDHTQLGHGAHPRSQAHMPGSTPAHTRTRRLCSPLPIL